MKEIKLSGKKGFGMSTLVDDEDFEKVEKYSWCFGNGYAKSQIPVKIRKDRKKWWYLHWSIIGKPSHGFEVDHINGNKLDNRRSNLRVGTISQNHANIGVSKRSTSGFKGVYWHKASKRWGVHIKFHNERKWLGVYKTKEDGAVIYNKKAKELFGEFAYQNPV